MQNIHKTITVYIQKMYEWLQAGNYRWQTFIADKKIFLFLPRNFIMFLFMISSFVIIFQQYTILNHTTIYKETHRYATVYSPIYKQDGEFRLYREGVDRDIDNIGIKFATYERINRAEYSLAILYKDEVVHEEIFNAKVLKDNEYYYFTVPKISKEELKDYKVRIRSLENDPHNTITVWCDSNQEVALSLNANKDTINGTSIAMVICVMMFFFLNYLVNTRECMETKLFLIASVYAVIVMFLMPPYQIPDERTHFLRTLNVSQYSFEQTPYENLMNNSLEFPLLGDKEINYGVAESRDSVKDINDIGKALQSRENDEVHFPGEIASPGTAFAYIVPAFVVKIVDTFSNSPLLIFYAGRIASLITNIVLMYMAIKITPKYKKLFLLIATMPMLVQTVGSYSYDGLLNSLCLLFVAMCLKCIFEKKEIKVSTMLILLGIITLIAIIKLPYILLGVFVFFIPKENFGDKKIKKVVSIIVGVISTLVLYRLSLKVSNIGAPNIEQVVNTEGSNFQYVLERPTRIFRIAMTTLQVKSKFYIDSLTGYFGYFSIKMHTMFSFALGGVLVGITKSEKNILTKKQRALLFMTMTLMIAGIFGALYFAWSTYKLPYVEGVQGRYFIPMIIPIILGFMNYKKSWELKKETVFMYINIVLLQYILLLLIYIY